VTELEIRDPDPDPHAPGGAEMAMGSGEGAEGSEGPYKNLLVPLVVVPALIVMVLVLVFVLFGAVAGKEDSPRQNLERVLNGGFNERKQAAFNLVRQVIEFEQARAAGRTSEWDIDAEFLPRLREARRGIEILESDKDVAIPLVLSSLLAQLGEPEGVEQLAEMTHLSEALDPAREYRLYSAMTLGAIGGRLAPAERELAARTLIALLDDADPGLVLVAIAGLQNLPSEATVPALRGCLASGVLEQRASAALSLATLEDAAGAEVLREMLSLAPYEAERAVEPHKWPAPRVSESRCKALAALLALGLAPSAEELRRLAAEEPDPNLRKLAAEAAAR